MKDLYELRVQSGAGWVLDSIYDDAAIATFEAQWQAQRLAGPTVRVVRVAEDAAPTVMGIVYESGQWGPTGRSRSAGTAPRVCAARAAYGLGAAAVVAAAAWVLVLLT